MNPANTQAVQKEKPAASSAITTGAPGPASPSGLSSAWKPPFWTVPVTGILFLGWIGYLVYLVVSLPQNKTAGIVVLSRPQFLVSDLDVVAEIKDLKGPVIVKAVAYPERAKSLVGQRIIVSNLQRCKHYPPNSAPEQEAITDFVDPGDYILALRPTALGAAVETVGLLAGPAGALLASAAPPPETETVLTYEVVPTPRSPGYPRNGDRPGPPHIYPSMPETRSQLEQIQKGK